MPGTVRSGSGPSSAGKTGRRGACWPWPPWGPVSVSHRVGTSLASIFLAQPLASFHFPEKSRLTFARDLGSGKILSLTVLSGSGTTQLHGHLAHPQRVWPTRPTRRCCSALFLCLVLVPRALFTWSPACPQLRWPFRSLTSLLGDDYPTGGFPRGWVVTQSYALGDKVNNPGRIPFDQEFNDLCLRLVLSRGASNGASSEEVAGDYHVCQAQPFAGMDAGMAGRPPDDHCTFSPWAIICELVYQAAVHTSWPVATMMKTSDGSSQQSPRIFQGTWRRGRAVPLPLTGPLLSEGR